MVTEYPISSTPQVPRPVPKVWQAKSRTSTSYEHILAEFVENLKSAVAKLPTALLVPLFFDASLTMYTQL